MRMSYEIIPLSYSFLQFDELRERKCFKGGGTGSMNESKRS